MIMTCWRMERTEFNTNIGKRIRRVREALGMTREQVSEAAGISSQFLFYIETGRKSMSAKTIVNLAKALNVSTDYLLLGNIEPVSSAASLGKAAANILRVLDGLSMEKLKLAETFLEDFSNGARKDAKKIRRP